MTAAVAGLQVTLSNCTVGAPYTITGPASHEGVCDAATMVFVLPYAGTYRITTECFPALDYEQEFAL